MNKLCLAFILVCILKSSFAQKEISFPPGTTVDPGIERVVKSKKDINVFKVDHFINDTISSQPTLNAFNKLPLTAFVTIHNNDTILTFTGMMLPWGFQINLNSDDSEVFTVISSRSCKCFKENLSKNDLSYQARAKSTSFTLVLNKITNIKAGDKIYGYLKTKGGNIYHFLGNTEPYEKWNLQYEGFFKVEFKPTQL